MHLQTMVFRIELIHQAKMIFPTEETATKKSATKKSQVKHLAQVWVAVKQTVKR